MLQKILNQTNIEQLITNNLAKHNFNGKYELSINFVSERKMRAINLKWRKYNAPTDVLSFGQIAIPNEPIRQLGDIYICPSIAKINAQEKNHSLSTELEFLIIHGLEHLLGIHHK